MALQRHTIEELNEAVGFDLRTLPRAPRFPASLAEKKMDIEFHRVWSAVVRKLDEALPRWEVRSTLCGVNPLWIHEVLHLLSIEEEFYRLIYKGAVPPPIHGGSHNPNRRK